MDNKLIKKLGIAENKIFDALIKIAEENQLSDIELTYCINRIAHNWTQAELMKKEGES